MYVYIHSHIRVYSFIETGRWPHSTVGTMPAPPAAHQKELQLGGGKGGRGRGSPPSNLCVSEQDKAHRACAEGTELPLHMHNMLFLHSVFASFLFLCLPEGISRFHNFSNHYNTGNVAWCVVPASQNCVHDVPGASTQNWNTLAHSIASALAVGSILTRR